MLSELGAYIYIPRESSLQLDSLSFTEYNTLNPYSNPSLPILHVPSTGRCITVPKNTVRNYSSACFASGPFVTASRRLRRFLRRGEPRVLSALSYFVSRSLLTERGLPLDYVRTKPKYNSLTQSTYLLVYLHPLSDFQSLSHLSNIQQPSTVQKAQFPLSSCSL
jgi:hypothetical protein